VDEDEIKKRYVSKDINKIISFMEKQSVYNLAGIYLYDYKKDCILRICRDGVITTDYTCRILPIDVIDGIKQNRYHIKLSYYLVDRETLTRSRQYRRLNHEETRISTPPPTLEEGEVLAEDLPEDGDRRISKKQLLSKLKQLLKANVSSFTKIRGVVVVIQTENKKIMKNKTKIMKDKTQKPTNEIVIELDPEMPKILTPDPADTLQRKDEHPKAIPLDPLDSTDNDEDDDEHKYRYDDPANLSLQRWERWCIQDPDNYDPDLDDDDEDEDV